MIFGKVVNPALKQSDDAIRGMRGDIESLRSLLTRTVFFPPRIVGLLLSSTVSLTFCLSLRRTFSRGLKTPFSNTALMDFAI